MRRIYLLLVAAFFIGNLTNIQATNYLNFSNNEHILPSSFFEENIYQTSPTNSPNDPNRSSGDVISIYSDAYTDASGIDYNPNWGQNTVVTQPEITPGNSALKYSNFNYQGTDFANNAIDVSNMQSLHLDYWSADATNARVFLISTGVEVSYTVTFTAGQWNSIDIPLTNFSAVDLTNVIQIKMDTTNSIGSTIYLDNIYFQAPLTAPNSSAPTPSANANDVISIYSDVYTNASGINYNPGWGQNTVVTQPTVATGDSVLKYSNFNYQGTDFANNAIDVSNMQSLHLDYWSADATNARVFLISTGVEVSYTVTFTAGQWNSIDIPLTNFSAVDLTNVIQIKMDTTNSIGSTIYLDNIYFQAPLTAPNSSAPTPSANANDVISIYSDVYTNASGINYNPGWGQNTVVTQPTVATGDSVLKYSNFNYQGTDFANNAIDVSNMQSLHLDYWSADATNARVFLISTGVEVSYTVTFTAGQWNSIDIPLTNFSAVDLTNVIQIKMDTTNSIGSTIYLDNIYFESAPPLTAPNSSAPTPSANANDVISIYSDVYTNASGINYNPGWGQNTVVTQPTVATGDSVLKYSNFNYQGTDFANNAIDVSNMQSLHLDYWSADATNARVFLISTGVEVSYTVTFTAGQWNSIDIPLTNFSAVDLTNVIQIKMDTTNSIGSTIYLDNIYFQAPLTAPNSSAPTLAQMQMTLFLFTVTFILMQVGLIIILDGDKTQL